MAWEIINKIMLLKKCFRVIYLLNRLDVWGGIAGVAFMTQSMPLIGIKNNFLDLKSINKCDLTRFDN
ncbi:hypothetical protein GCM10011520_17700 [Shewanella carassii]|uniref:Uncharacterized protein n=1 Tax=Shewanella carassii TaxID=1987584 RepID=A0ABQ1T121_9GAMM|nr:hypothetical protein GCM10011520_17700 [Shewanella carassii]